MLLLLAADDAAAEGRFAVIFVMRLAGPLEELEEAGWEMATAPRREL